MEWTSLTHNSGVNKVDNFLKQGGNLENLTDVDCWHWQELDDESGQLYEYCRAKRQRCACSGYFKQCNYKRYFNANPRKIRRLNERDSILKLTAEEDR